jgi:hypothetical protein
MQNNSQKIYMGHIRKKKTQMEQSLLISSRKGYRIPYPKLLNIFGDNFILDTFNFWQGQNIWIMQNELLQFVDISTETTNAKIACMKSLNRRVMSIKTSFYQYELRLGKKR